MTILDAAELRRVLAAGEGRQVEFKEGLGADGRAARTLCAFANTRGGLLLVGVDDRARVTGVPRHAAVAAALRMYAARAITPPVAVRIEALTSGGRTVVCCSVPLSPARPHAIGGDIVVRAGSSNRVATAAAATALGERSRPDADERRLFATLEELGAADAATCARATGMGKQKARRALERLEHAGLLVAHGLGDRRVYEPVTATS